MQGEASLLLRMLRAPGKARSKAYLSYSLNRLTLVGFLGLLRPGSVAQLITASMVAILLLLAHAIAQAS